MVAEQKEICTLPFTTDFSIRKWKPKKMAKEFPVATVITFKDG